MQIKDIPLIIIAAGRSSRMGFPKGLYLYEGSPLLEHQIASYFKMGGKEIIVVLGEHSSSYQKKIPLLKKCTLVFNDQIDLGPFYSIQLSIKNLSNKNYAFLLPLDTPAPSPSVWKSLIRKTTENTYACIPSFKNKGGHPVLLSKKFLDKLILLNPRDPESRLDFQIKKISPEFIIRVPLLSSSILENINTPQGQ